MLKKESERSAPVMDEKRRTLRQLLKYLEEALGEKPYFLGDFSLTDIAVIPRFLRMETYRAMPAPTLPKLNQWLQRMKARSSVKAIL